MRHVDSIPVLFWEEGHLRASALIETSNRNLRAKYRAITLSQPPTPRSEAAMRRLPPELLALILDWGTVPDLVRLSHVDSLWRACVQEHPAYWMRIRLAQTEQPALEFFAARLAQGRMRDCELTLDISQLHSEPAVSCVVEALRNHLHRITVLSIAMSSYLPRVIFPRLCAPAPRLRSLTLSHQAVYDAESVAYLQALPAGIFRGDSTTLRSVVLEYIKLGPSPPAALSGLRTLRISVCYPGALPLPWLYELKNLDDLFIYALTSVSLAHLPDGMRLRHITHLALIIDDHYPDDAVRACADARQWLAANLDALQTARFLLDRLRGPLHLRVRCDPLFSLEYHAPEQGVTRVFASWRVPGLRTESRLYYDGLYFGRTITQLRLPTNCLALGLILPPLPAVTRLVVDVVADEPVRVYHGARLVLPRLETVVLCMHWPLDPQQREGLVRFLAEGVVSGGPVEYETETPRVGDVSPLREAFLKTLFGASPKTY